MAYYGFVITRSSVQSRPLAPESKGLSGRVQTRPLLLGQHWVRTALESRAFRLRSSRTWTVPERSTGDPGAPGGLVCDGGPSLEFACGRNVVTKC